MFPQSVIHRDGSPPPLRGTEAGAPGRAWPRWLRGDGVLQTKGPLVRGGGPGDDPLLAQLSHHVLNSLSQCCHSPPSLPHDVPSWLGRRNRVDDDGSNLLDEVTVIKTVESDQSLPTWIRMMINKLIPLLIYQLSQPLIRTMIPLTYY